MKLAQTYRIETERLVIRCYEPTDAQKLMDAITVSLDHLLPWMPWAKNEPENLEAKINRLRLFRGQFDLGQDYTYGIFDKTEKELIGSTGLHTRLNGNAREIGYWINVKHINKGFATEAVNALTKVGFEIEQLSQIQIHCSANNIKSQNIPKKLGYKLLTINENKSTENISPTMIWTMLDAMYETSPLKKMNLKAYNIFGSLIG